MFQEKEKKEEIGKEGVEEWTLLFTAQSNNKETQRQQAAAMVVAVVVCSCCWCFCSWCDGGRGVAECTEDLEEVFCLHWGHLAEGGLEGDVGLQLQNFRRVQKAAFFILEKVTRKWTKEKGKKTWKLVRSGTTYLVTLSKLITYRPDIHIQVVKKKKNNEEEEEEESEHTV